MSKLKYSYKVKSLFIKFEIDKNNDGVTKLKILLDVDINRFKNKLHVEDLINFQFIYKKYYRNKRIILNKVKIRQQQ